MVDIRSNGWESAVFGSAKGSLKLKMSHCSFNSFLANESPETAVKSAGDIFDDLVNWDKGDIFDELRLIFRRIGRVKQIASNPIEFGVIEYPSRIGEFDHELYVTAEIFMRTLTLAA